MAYKDLGNNIQFDPETGQIQIVDQSGAQQYMYDPRSDKTLLGNQYYTGELNPQVLAAITPEEYQNAINKYQTVGSLNLPDNTAANNAFGNTLGDYSNEQNTLMNQYGSLATEKSTMDAYNAQLAQMGDLGDPFSTAIKNLASQQGVLSANDQQNANIQSTINQGQQTADQYKTSHPGVSDDVAAVMSNANLSDAVKQAILGQNYVGTQAAPIAVKNPFDTGKGQTFDYSVGHYVPTTSASTPAPTQSQLQQTVPQPVPTASVNPVVTPDITQPAPSDTSAATPAAQPDYNGLLTQFESWLQPYMTGSSTPSSTPDTTTNAAANASSTFNIGGTSTTKAPVLADQSSSPDFSLGGYNAQSNYQDTSSSQMSGKSGTSSGSTSQSSGMATGQFGSK